MKNNKSKTGPKPKGIVKIKWSSNFAYAIGLLVSDGSLSKDKRHVIFTSKDIDQIKNFQKALGINLKIGKSYSDASGKRRYYNRIQIGDVLFWNFLFKIGIMPNKSKIVGKIKIPPKYFYDFVRGSFDGDGCFYSYWDPRWRSSHMFYFTLSSASLRHIEWLRENIKITLKISGHISKSKRKGSIFNLRFGKKESIRIINKLYYSRKLIFLRRKMQKIDKAMVIEKKQQMRYIIDKPGC